MVEYSFKDVTNQVRILAQAIRSYGFPPGSSIAIFSKNCAHWLMADWAIWLAGHVSIPIFGNSSKEYFHTVLKHSESKLLFIGKLDNPAEAQSWVPAGLPCINFPYHPMTGASEWNELVKKHRPLQTSVPRGLSELATIIYTSGTTGEPKGVMHPFSSIAMAGREVLESLQVTESESFISYLPLAHVAERLLIETGSLYCGGSVTFVESLDTFARQVQELQPTIFLAVPRLWQKFQEGVHKKIPQKRLNLLLKIPVLNEWLKKKIRFQLGLSRVHYTFTGSAPIPVPLLEWFQKLGITIRDVYSMTENFAISHINWNEVRFGSGGQPWPHVNVKLSPEGEILVESPCNFRGYFKHSSQRDQLFDGNYFRTGDTGVIDPEGFIFIKGRVKEIFKTTKGKYVPPAKLEGKLLSTGLFDQVCVVGDGMPQPIAIAILLAGADGSTENLTRTLNQINAGLEDHERLSKIVLVKDQWTIENGFLTPSMKLKRPLIEEKYQSQFKNWETNKDVVVAL